MENKRKRILIIGSSMSMPRLEVDYEQTWIYQLIERFPNIHFIDKSRRGSTSERLVKEGGGFRDTRRGADILEYYEPNIIITQIGITDCAPRFLQKNKLSTKIINSLPKRIKSIVYFFVKKLFKRDVKKADVSLPDFKNNWINYIERSKKINAEVLCLLISKPTTIVKEKSPEIENAINLYNQELINLEKKHSNFHVLEPFTLKEINAFSIDEFHVNFSGHQTIFEKIKLELAQKFEIKP